MRSCGTLIRILVCIGIFGVFLYSYIDKQNAVTEHRLKIPVLSKRIKDLKQFNTQLRYDISLFENPEHLMKLAKNSNFSHLKQPMLKEIRTIQEALALEVVLPNQEQKGSSRSKVPLATLHD